MVDQLSEAARALPVEWKHEPRQIPQARFVEFLVQGPAQFEPTIGQKIGES